MSHIQATAPFYPVEQHAGDIISSYMSRDFISLPEHLNIKEARELFYRY